MAPHYRRGPRLSLRELVDRRAEIEAAASAKRVVFLFHTAFCGSTLLANCLDQRGVCLAYKEPLSLTQVSLAKPAAERPPAMSESEWLELRRSTVALLSKVFDPSEVALVKTANSCLGVIPELLSATRAGGRAILLYSNLTDFLCSILKSEGRRRWARLALDWVWSATPSHRFLAGIDKSRLSDEAAAAYVWLWQMYAYLDVCESEQSCAVRLLDCDVFFSRPEETLAEAARFLSLALTAEGIARITSGKVFHTYSKSRLGETRFGTLLRRLGFSLLRAEPFDADQRRSLLQQTAERHAREIESALTWTRNITSGRPIPDPLPQPLLT
jgi:hypothetical protein